MESARLDWSRLGERIHLRWLERYRELLALRRREIVPRVPEAGGATSVTLHESGAFAVEWTMSDGALLRLYANLTESPAPVVGRTSGRPIFTTPADYVGTAQSGQAPPWCVAWRLETTQAPDGPRP
jgi:hypothetical protein